MSKKQIVNYRSLTPIAWAGVVFALVFLPEIVLAAECMDGYKLDRKGKCICDGEKGYAKTEHAKAACVKCIDYDMVVGADGMWCTKCELNEIIKDGKCVKCAGNEVITDDKCVCDAANNYYKDASGACVKCSGDNKIVKNNQCVCNDVGGFFECPAASGKCIAKCKSGEICGSTGACVSECEVGEIKTAEGCVCDEKNNYAKYPGVSNARCVPCGAPYGYAIAGVCNCKDSFHVSLRGNCVPDDSANSCNKDDPNAVLKAGTCVCKDGYGWDPGDTNPKATYAPLCKDLGLPKLDCSLPENEKAVECDCSLPENKDAEFCTGAGTAGDCGCNFGAEAPNAVQVFLPYLLLAAGGVGLRVWRRRLN